MIRMSRMLRISIIDNSYGSKTILSYFGEIEIRTLRDGSFEPAAAPKRQKDVSDIRDKVFAMYARSISQRDVSSTIEDIYGFKLS